MLVMVDWEEFDKAPPLPPMYFRINVTKKSYWYRMARVLYWMATERLSTRMDIALCLGLPTTSTGSVFRLMQSMEKDDLIIREDACVTTGIRFSMIRLSEKGKKVCRHYGWEVEESDWERLIRLHQANNPSQKRHAAAILFFAHHARLRGYDVETMPELVGNTAFEPDIALFRDTHLEDVNEEIYVEIEMLSQRSKINTTKWKKKFHNQLSWTREYGADPKGYLAIVTTNEERLDNAIDALTEDFFNTRLYASDFTYLSKGAKQKELNLLWSHEYMI